VFSSLLLVQFDLSSFETDFSRCQLDEIRVEGMRSLTSPSHTCTEPARGFHRSSIDQLEESRSTDTKKAFILVKEARKAKTGDSWQVL